MNASLFACAESAQGQIKVIKYENGVRRDLCGAFSRSSVLRFELILSPEINAHSAVIRIQPDGCDWFDIPFVRAEDGAFSLDIDLSELCKSTHGGLFFYEFLLICPDKTYFTDTCDNNSATLTLSNAGRFSLLVLGDNFTTPEWFHGRTMYQIFPDRFYRTGNCKKRADAVINDDWENGIPQFAEVVGGEIENNEFFGGTLDGITEKLDYIASLGADVIYLNPIFEAYSNHKYDTADYMRVDEMLGGDRALERLLSEAEKRDIRIILDGVFNHTGSDSVYFNAKGRYASLGAAQSENSPYRSWYRFKEDGSYECWWGIKILPRLDHDGEGCADYFLSDNGVIAKYLKMGASGWRLDVADELSDSFLDGIRRAAVKAKSDAVIIGEVWENAATKIAYGARRRYLLGEQLDSVMNYPFRNALISYLTAENAEMLAHTLTEIFSTYPRSVSHSLMNIIGTHDTERILSVLGDRDFDLCSMRELSTRRLSADARDKAKKLLKIASAIQYTAYGVPSLYYGDEAGMEGYRDPFCRMPFPWGREDSELVSHYKRLGEIRKSSSLFADGEFKVLYAGCAVIIFERRKGDKVVYLIANASDNSFNFAINGACTDLLTHESFDESITLPPYSVRIIKEL
ncbi:MAG: glycoside hydrolase family 13 protein [Clostridia bacterium]|nr:glycoside hydrolase family 13 protein [Clostridia bacterium]